MMVSSEEEESSDGSNSNTTTVEEILGGESEGQMKKNTEKGEESSDGSNKTMVEEILEGESGDQVKKKIHRRKRKARRLGRRQKGVSKAKQLKTENTVGEADSLSPKPSTSMPSPSTDVRSTGDSTMDTSALEEEEVRIESSDVTEQSSPQKKESESLTKRKYTKRKHQKTMPRKRAQKLRKLGTVKEQSYYDDLVEISLNASTGTGDVDNDEMEETIADEEEMLDREEWIDATTLDFQENTERWSPPMDLTLEEISKMYDVIGILVDEMRELTEDRKWVVEEASGSFRMYVVSALPQAAVVKCVTWRDKNTEIYLHGSLLPPESYLYDLAPLSETEDLSEIIERLKRLADILDYLPVCSGIQEHQELWSVAAETSRGFIERGGYQGNLCFRSKDCLYIETEGRRCKECRRLEEHFQKKEKNAAESQPKDATRVNNRYMSREELLTKVADVQEKRRKEKKKHDKLRKKYRKMMERDSIRIGDDLSTDLSKILERHKDKLTDIQRIFWEEQVKAMSKQKDLRGMRWNPMMIKIALHLQMISQSAYRYLKKSRLLTLPSERTLYDFTHFADTSEGVQKPMLDNLRKKVYQSCKTEDQKYFNVIFDEMHIRSDLVISTRTGEIIGYTKLSDVEQELANLENEVTIGSTTNANTIAKKVLVYMAQGITTDFQEIVGVYSTTDVSSAQLYSRTWEIIYNLERRGLKVLCLVCDGASSNRKFLKMHVPYGSAGASIYSTKNLACGEDDRLIFFIIDPPHVLKTLRNSLANSYSHQNSRKLWKNKETLSWKVIEQLFEITLTEKYKDHKLTRSHIKLTSFSRMTVRYAAQVLSKSVANALRRFKKDHRFHGMHLEELIKCIEIINRWFDCFNGSGDVEGKRNKENPDLLPYTEVNDSRFEFLRNTVLGYFDEWSNEVNMRKGKFSKTEREKMMISSRTIEGVYITTTSFIEAVQFILKINPDAKIDAKSFNQDKLEQYFGIMRMSGGASNNPDLQRFLQKGLSIHVQSKAALPPSKGNTQTEVTGLQVEEEPLLRRKRK